jgi:hypothetical protein
MNPARLPPPGFVLAWCPRLASRENGREYVGDDPRLVATLHYVASVFIDHPTWPDPELVLVVTPDGKESRYGVRLEGGLYADREWTDAEEIAHALALRKYLDKLS